MKENDLVEIIEAAYRINNSTESWLEEVVRAARPHLDCGRGVYAFEFDASEPGRFEIGAFADPEEAMVVPDLVRKWHRVLRMTDVLEMYRGSRPLATIGQRLQLAPAELESNPAMLGFCRGLGIRDQLTVRAADPSYRGLSICAPLAEHVAPQQAQVRLWTLLATHVCAGYRLRLGLSHLTQESSNTDGVAAILGPDGRVHHAEGEAKRASSRESLREAVRSMDRARGALRRSAPEEAVAIWRGLVDGRWSLIDRFESDGRRFLVARRNRPRARRVPSLSAREHEVAGYAAMGHANKEIAYALGLSENTVARYIANAKRKLSVGSRVELIRAIRSVLDPDPQN